jgi:hypothetical protein
MHPITIPTVELEDGVPGVLCSFLARGGRELAEGEGERYTEVGKESPNSTTVAYVLLGREIVRVRYDGEEREAAFILGGSR